MNRERGYFGIILILFGVVFLFGNRKTVEAEKYYSLQNIGLSGCTTDRIDYSILSIRGNTIRYVVYQFSDKDCEWVQIGEVRKAKLTLKTKYYMGNLNKLTQSAKNNDSVDEAKWMSRIYKGTVKRKMLGRYNEIQIRNGKVTKVAIRLNY